MTTGAGFALSNPVAGFVLVVALGCVAAYVGYRSYYETTPHTRER